MLAITKIGAVLHPELDPPLRGGSRYRVDHGRARAVITLGALTDRLDGIGPDILRIGVGDGIPSGWARFDDSTALPRRSSSPTARPPSSDTALLYFTSGTTNRPKLVQHTHASYPIGHLSTMWWLGVRPDDVHLNISSPGWAKHAWSSF